MIILGIETSCDETALCIYKKKKKIIINKIFKQNKIHNKNKGIIPEIASKYHYKKIIYIFKKIIKKSKIKIKNIKLIAYTAGPGLPNSLIIGTTLAKTLSFIYKIPSIPINHIEGHIMSIMLNKIKPKFPFISLITSGANTILCIVKKFNKYKIIGKCIDDSAGEVFDKISKFLKFKKLGGKYISKIAKYGKKNLNFPKPLMNKKNFNFSFSGLKTHIKNYIKNKNINFQKKADISLSLEECITDILIYKIKNACKKYNINKICIVGGVSKNNKLRKKIKNLKKNKIKTYLCKKKFCTDNAAMIAYTALNKNIKKIKNILEIKIKPKWKINENF